MVKALIIGNGIMIVLLVWRWQFLPPQIPLFYSQPWGEDQLVDTWMIGILPALMNILWILNTLIAKRFFKNDTIMLYILHIANIVDVVAFTVMFAKIILFIT